MHSKYQPVCYIGHYTLRIGLLLMRYRLMRLAHMCAHRLPPRRSFRLGVDNIAA